MSPPSSQWPPSWLTHDYRRRRFLPAAGGSAHPRFQDTPMFQLVMNVLASLRVDPSVVGNTTLNGRDFDSSEATTASLLTSSSLDGTTISYDPTTNKSTHVGAVATVIVYNWSTVFIILFGGLLCLLTGGGNFMVMLSFKIDRQLQTISNYFLFSLAVADISVGFISIPLMTIYTVQNQWTMGYLVCQLWLCMDYLMSNASVLNLLLISFDRYFSITRPLTYRPRRTNKKAFTMIASTYLISLILWPPWIISWPYIEGRFAISDQACMVQFLKTNPYVTIGTAIAAFYLPVTIMIVLYARVYRETRKRQSELHRLQASHESGPRKRRADDSSSAVSPVQSCNNHVGGKGSTVSRCSALATSLNPRMDSARSTSTNGRQLEPEESTSVTSKSIGGVLTACFRRGGTMKGIDAHVESTRRVSTFSEASVNDGASSEADLDDSLVRERTPARETTPLRPVPVTNIPQRPLSLRGGRLRSSGSTVAMASAEDASIASSVFQDGAGLLTPSASVKARGPRRQLSQPLPVAHPRRMQPRSAQPAGMLVNLKGLFSVHRQSEDTLDVMDVDSSQGESTCEKDDVMGLGPRNRSFLRQLSQDPVGTMKRSFGSLKRQPPTKEYGGPKVMNISAPIHRPDYRPKTYTVMIQLDSVSSAPSQSMTASDASTTRATLTLHEHDETNSDASCSPISQHDPAVQSDERTGMAVTTGTSTTQEETETSKPSGESSVSYADIRRRIRSLSEARSSGTVPVTADSSGGVSSDVPPPPTYTAAMSATTKKESATIKLDDNANTANMADIRRAAAAVESIRHSKRVAQKASSSRSLLRIPLLRNTSDKSRKRDRQAEKKQESKAAKTLSAILLAFILTWTPYNLIVCIEAVYPGTVNDLLWTLSYYLCYLNSTINPLCYALCNQRFRNTYLRILKCKFSGAPQPLRSTANFGGSTVSGLTTTSRQQKQSAAFSRGGSQLRTAGFLRR